MTKQMPVVTKEQQEALIEWAKGYIEAAERLVQNYPKDRSAKAYLNLLEIALAALSADYAGEVVEVGGIRVVEWERCLQVGDRVFTAPPVPVMTPVVRPYLPDDCDRTEAHYKYCEAIRAAGGTIAGSGE